MREREREKERETRKKTHVLETKVREIPHHFPSQIRVRENEPGKEEKTQEREGERDERGSRALVLEGRAQNGALKKLSLFVHVRQL